MRTACLALYLWCLLATPSSAGATTIEGVPTGTAAFIGLAREGPIDQPVLVKSVAEFADEFGPSSDGLPNPYLAPSVAAFFANGGERLWVVRASAADDTSLIGVDGGGPGTRTGLQTLRDVDDISAVAIPGGTSKPVQTAMISLCEAMGDRIALLDPASTDDIHAVLTQRAGLDSPLGDAALYFPWIEASPDGTTLLLPPSGFVAGVFARTDLPDSPVGTVSTATDVSYRLSTQETETLTQAGVNAIRYFAGPDVRIWGARTLSPDPEWRYVSVRRTALYLQESVHEGTEWAVFEDNDETLWSALRASVEDFLLERFQEGWFQGSSPSQAFFVRCDQTTMTQDDIDEGRTILLMGFAPLQPAEFVVLSIVHERNLTSQVPFEPPPTAPTSFVFPNPSSESVTIRFHLERPEPGKVRIFNSAGRRIRSFRVSGLAGTWLAEPGSLDVVWDGRDESGRRVPSGVYHARIETPTANARALLLRIR